ncbi:hypothetical protein [Sulfolobus acidocaldarius]|uniref:hypothetical protein n=1 Tax=Sulfolobus acidocaldarius TaxID=2285 RepID=UPI000A5B2B69|nr:hypothetical protein [Sulfolobus acidocaldarius]
MSTPSIPQLIALSVIKYVGKASYRYDYCLSYGYENDRDVIATVNLYGKGSLSFLIASYIREVSPNL